MSSNVEEIMKRISGNKGVKALIIINKDGLLLASSMEVSSATDKLIKNVHELTVAARRLVRDVDPCDDLLFLRAKSAYEEILVSPDAGFTVVVIQEFVERKEPETQSLDGAQFLI